MSDSDRGKRSQNLTAAAFCAVAIFGTVIIVYAIGVTLGVDSGRNQVTAREHYESAKQDNLRACAGREVATAIECVTEAIEAAQEQSDSRQDLYAQQDMSRWALWMLVASVATFLVTAIGVWFVKRTLDATLEAVEDTSEATRQITRQNDLAEFSQRPWLRFNIVKMSCLTEAERGIVWIDYDVEVENMGAMPAFCGIPMLRYSEDVLEEAAIAERAMLMLDTRVLKTIAKPNGLVRLHNTGSSLHLGGPLDLSIPSITEGRFFLALPFQSPDRSKRYCAISQISCTIHLNAERRELTFSVVNENII